MASSYCVSCSTWLQRQNLVCCLRNPHCGSLICADGHGEVWTDWNDTSKFFQYGWRCTTNEDSYSNCTLMGNWNQERYDLKNIIKPKPLSSQFGHYFETTYDTSYNSKKPLSTHRFRREPRWFPGHQPELDPLNTNAQKSQLICIATQSLKPGIFLGVSVIQMWTNFRVQESKRGKEASFCWNRM